MIKPRRKMDWKGLTVKNISILSNRLGDVPALTRLVVESVSRRGLEVKTLPCNCCGAVLRFFAVDESDLRIENTDENRLSLEWNRKRKYEKTYYGHKLVYPNYPCPYEN